MSVSKFFFCKNLLSSNITFLSSSKWASVTFRTSSSLSRGLIKRCNTAQILSKPKITFEFLTRNTATAAAVQAPVRSIQKRIGFWLFSCSFLVYSTIIMGGYTRLTESGLSMVTWRFTYEKFPTSEDEWIAEFEKYKQYPEFKMLKQDITLDGFKQIFLQEYLHRNFGRIVGIAFAIPAAIFWMKGHFKPLLKKRVLFFGSLIVAQGLLGWYMVKSGLEDRFHNPNDVPRVSQYRLAAHLGLALTLYIGLILSTFELLYPTLKPSGAVAAGARKIRMLAHTCKGLIFLTAISGAFVAGLDAGLVYNSFPKMGDRWIPDDILALSPVLKNFTENPTTVQFNHRILGITTFSAIMATWFLSRNKGLPRPAKFAVNLLALGALAQVSLGISTLVHHVPTNLAISHQTGSVLLLTLAAWLSHQLKYLKHVPK